MLEIQLPSHSTILFLPLSPSLPVPSSTSQTLPKMSRNPRTAYILIAAERLERQLSLDPSEHNVHIISLLKLCYDFILNDLSADSLPASTPQRLEADVHALLGEAATSGGRGREVLTETLNAKEERRENVHGQIIKFRAKSEKLVEVMAFINRPARYREKMTMIIERAPLRPITRK